ncbi:MAG: chorismate synthase [Deltaproteobacteria bacterium]|nr:chorismate synthase [Deltaproteobacteria bacterium]
MNSLGRLFRVSIFGESHGPSIGALVDGCPAGLALEEADFAADLARRRSGARGTTPRRERDLPRLLSGVFQGRTTGAPLLVAFNNEDTDSSSYREVVHRPRPGHADLVAHQKHGGFADWRGSGHFSGRLTVALVAAGVIAKKTMPKVRISARVIEAGGQGDVEKALAEAERAQDSIGGVVECQVEGLPAGLGEPFFDSAESLLAHAAFSIPAVKAVEFGAGHGVARMRGSEYADAILNARGRTATHHAGGINGGLTNGNRLVVRVAVRPPSSSASELSTVDLRSGKRVRMVPKGRHDRCVALRVPVVLEAAVAMVLADLMVLEQRTPRVPRGRRGSKR